ncbi:MAG: glycosyltransferase family 4 protein [Patescibacteria group bacterium]|nr:glycosyltransferase family 4 protein [Patescibacteria group bacterium]
MRILLLQFPLQPAWGGAETHTCALVRGLTGGGNEILTVSSNRALVSALKLNGHRARYLWCGWEPTSISALLLFPATLIMMLPVFLFLFLAFRPHRTVCLTLADKLIATPLAKLCASRVFWIEHTRLGRWIFASPLRPWFILNSHLTTVVTHSYFLRNQLLRLGMAIENMKVIYPGTPIPAPVAPREKSSRLTLGYLGRLAAEKGVDVLLNAVAELSSDASTASQNPDRPQLLIAGAGPTEITLKNLAFNLRLGDGAVFLGVIKNKSDFFARVDCLVVPSVEAESFGLTIIEAMAAGIPVVASKIGAIPEILEHQKTGLLCSPGDKNSIIESVQWLFADAGRRQQIVVTASNSVRSRFTEKKMLDAYRDLICKC